MANLNQIEKWLTARKLRLVLIGFLLWLVHGAQASVSVDAELATQPSSGVQESVVSNVISGFFGDPDFVGQGFVIEVIAPDRAVVYWFTFDRDGRQRWFLAIGELDETGITVSEWLSTSGPEFGSAYSPEDLEYHANGNARFDILSCNEVDVTYEIDGLQGTQSLKRLTSVADRNCNGIQSHRSGLSGSFGDPQRDGEGVVVHFYGDDKAAAIFFTYNHLGEQMWVLALGRIEGDQLIFDDAFTTSGGKFGPEYDPGQVSYHPWGGLDMQTGCEQSGLAFQPDSSDLETGQVDMQRIVWIDGLECDPGATFELPLLECGSFNRAALDAERLDSAVANTIVDNSEFTPAVDCKAALHRFEGRLGFDSQPITISGTVDPNHRVFPDIELELVSVQDYLVPVQAGLLRGTVDSIWEVVFSNGRIWSEPGDGGRSRAAIPFLLSNRQWNEAHQGLMTFLYDENGISRLHFQATQENLPWAENVNFRGALQAVYERFEPSDAYLVERQFRRDLAMRMPQKTLDDLAAIYGEAALGPLNRGVPTENINQSGVVVDDVLYLGDSNTRSGNYPFPEEMRHGAFSVSKTIGAAVALLRLAQKYGASVFDELVRDHIEVTADHDGWDEVTFHQALSMVTGIGDASPDPLIPDTFADENNENNPHYQVFNYSTSMALRLWGAFQFGNYPWGPGEVMRYNSAHTMILAVAMENFLKSKEGPDADLWTMLNEEVYQPIGIRWLPSMRLHITSSMPGPVPLGWGLLPNSHDLARIAALLHNHGEFEGQQLLHRELTMQAIRENGEPAYDTASWNQLEIGQWVPTSYRDGTWSSRVDQSGACGKIASRMEGFGGNLVVMLPSGVTAFRWADANIYDSGGLILAAENIRPSCPD